MWKSIKPEKVVFADDFINDWEFKVVKFTNSFDEVAVIVVVGKTELKIAPLLNVACPFDINGTSDVLPSAEEVNVWTSKFPEFLQ